MTRSRTRSRLSAEVLARVKAANHKDRVSKSAKRKGQMTAQAPMVKLITNGIIPPKKTT